MKYFWPRSENLFLISSSCFSKFSAFWIILSCLTPSITFSSNKNFTISSSVIPAWIFKISILLSPLLINSDNFLINDVFPQPVSPIMITGIFSLILNNINTILIKLSAVKTYSPTISSIDFNFLSSGSFLFFSFSTVYTGLVKSNICFISSKNCLCLNL